MTTTNESGASRVRVGEGTSMKRLGAVASLVVGLATLVTGTGRAAEPTCREGRVVVGDGCCWPEQRWEAGRCQGPPRCPSGMVPSKGECVTRASYAAALGVACAELPVGLEAAPTDHPARRACDELAGDLLRDAEPGWSKACERDDAKACLLLGGARQGYRTASERVEMWVARCKATDNCHRARRSRQRLGFGGIPEDTVAAVAAFSRACKAGLETGCLELGQQMSNSKKVHRDACVVTRDPRACAKAAYEIGVVGRVEDAELMDAAQRALGGACDAGGGVACTNLGFLTERKVAGARTPQAAAVLYRRGCELGHVLGCASLVMATVRTPALARGMAWGDAAKRLEAGCNESEEGTHESCLAFGFALQRGFGTKANPGRGAALVQRLCKAGFTDACVR